MAQEGFKRKLAAILSADAAGYSRPISEDETHTIQTLKMCRDMGDDLDNFIEQAEKEKKSVFGSALSKYCG